MGRADPGKKTAWLHRYLLDELDYLYELLAWVEQYVTGEPAKSRAQDSTEAIMAALLIVLIAVVALALVLCGVFAWVCIDIHHWRPRRRTRQPWRPSLVGSDNNWVAFA